MTPEALHRMGPQALARLASQLGLRGASIHDAETLRRALGAYFAGSWTEPDPREPEEEPDSIDLTGYAVDAAVAGLAIEGLPPALKTETMARLLETQGKRAEATALREDLRRHQGGDPLWGAPQGGAQEPTSREPSTQGHPWIRLDVDEEHFRLRWHLGPQDADPAAMPQDDVWQIELWIWRGRGSRITRKVAVTEPRGEQLLDRPADAALAAAMLGQRHRGALRPVTRTALWRAEPLLARPPSARRPPEGDPSDPGSPASK